MGQAQRPLAVQESQPHGAAHRARLRQPTLSEPQTLVELLASAAHRFGARPALAFPPDQLPDASFTFTQLAERVERAAASLAALGVERGDHVGLLLHNRPEVMILWLAAASLGAVTVPLNARYRPREIAYVVEQARINVLFTASARGNEPDLAIRAREALSNTELISVSGGLSDLVAMRLAKRERNNARATARSIPAPDDPALLMYTSGTTANPKGCLISHRTLLAAGKAMASAQCYGLSTGDRMWNPLPLFHMSSLHPFTACLWSGCTFVSMTHFDPAIAAKQVTEQDITILYPAFLTIANDLLGVPGFAGDRVRRLRRINCVAPPDGLRRLQERFPQAKVTSVYGLTEAGGVVAYGSADEPLDVRVSSCGRPFEGIDARIVPTEGSASGGDRAGEIQLKGWCLFLGYFEQPEATRAALTGDGWLRTGDIGFIDDAGCLHYRGRLKDVIRVSGENVSAIEIESVLMCHPAVKVAQVIGIPDERHGEVPVAFVELHAGAGVNDETLLLQCRSDLAGFKVPRRILFVTEWPMSATKIQKHRLRELL